MKEVECTLTAIRGSEVEREEGGESNFTVEGEDGRVFE